jgi:hypothetical protein
MRPTDRQAPVQEEPCSRDGHIGIAVVHQLGGLRLQAVQGPQQVFLDFCSSDLVISANARAR